MGCVLVLSGCGNHDEGVSDNEAIPEGMQQITFLLPDYDGGSARFGTRSPGTRAFDTQEEGYMSNLYIIAVKYKDYEYDEEGNYTIKEYTNEEDRQVFTFSLNPVGEKFQLSKDNQLDGQYDTFDYHAFNVTLYPGEYRFGVLANVDLYLTRANKISEFTKESDLDNIVLNFNEDTPLAPFHLPMVCMPQNIKYSIGANGNKTKVDEDGLVKIEKVKKDDNDKTDRSTHIWVDMSFLCSKVRYTILFNKNEGEISEAFGSSWIRFNVDDQLKPTAYHIRRQTQLMPGISTGAGIYDETNPFLASASSTTDEGTWIMSIDRYNWPTEGANYPKTPDSQLDPWTGTTAEWIPQLAKAWQGVVYLPENNGSTIPGSTERIANTVLRFPCHIRDNNNDDTPEEEGTPKEITLFEDATLYESNSNSTGYEEITDNNKKFTGLERNYMYDVVALVKNPDLDEMDIRVFISVLPWHEIDQNLDEDWLHNTTDKKDSN